MYCPNCGQKIADNSKFCQFCGEKIINASKSQKKQTSGLIQKALFIVAIILCIALLVGILWNRKSSPLTPVSISSSDSGSNEIESNGSFTNEELFSIAQQIVLDNLKAPSSAKFCEISESTFEYGEFSKVWFVTGWVEAQNPFGVMLRQHFMVSFEPIRSGKNIGYQNPRATFS